MKKKSGFAFNKPVGLGNQLVVLYHVFNTYPEVEDLYFPCMDSCRHYFNSDKFRCGEYYHKNMDKFRLIEWEETKDAGNLLRFTELDLKPEYQDKIKSMVDSFGNRDLVAVHMRHGDYDHWNDGKFYFTKDQYMEKARQSIELWGLENPAIVVFSNDRKDGCVTSWDLTGGDGVLDLFLMSHFNYFVRTFSTFSGVASRLSQNRGLFKGEVVLQ